MATTLKDLLKAQRDQLQTQVDWKRAQLKQAQTDVTNIPLEITEMEKDLATYDQAMKAL